jgi:glycosyltransferase involved in cell wall biosynthesis
VASELGLDGTAVHCGAVGPSGLLVPPKDAPALAAALRRLIGDRRERDRLAMNARAGAARLPTWQDSARLFAGAIQTVG